MNLVIIGRFPAATDTQIRAFLPADREVFITESDLSGPFCRVRMRSSRNTSRFPLLGTRL
ncbi:hypothetical protein HMPREF1545_01298 [Oscillibacter sp. KLE 1728]|nr:hypothetical protein HMPREF1545_01298 [Oscillibacter sp. KLE 1728]